MTLIQAVNSDAIAGALFHAALVPRDTFSIDTAGAGLIDPAAHRAHNRRQRNAARSNLGSAGPGGRQKLRDQLGGTAQTVEDVLNLINGSGAGYCICTG
jgi:hypothetical protein